MTIILQTLTEHKKEKIRESMLQLGLPTHFPPITTSNRAIVRSLLNGIGFQTHVYLNSSLDDLSKACASLTNGASGVGLIPFIIATDNTLDAEKIRSNILECFERAGIDDNAVMSRLDIQSILNGLPKNEEPVVNAATTNNPAPASNDITKQASDAIAALMQSIANKPQDLDEKKVIALIRQHSQATQVTIKTPDNSYTVPTGLHHKILPDVLLTMKTGLNVCLVGPAGSGKTTMAMQLATCLSLPFYFNGAIDSEYKLTGFMDAQGRYVSTAFRKAYETGGVYLFDEIDASSASALLAFNASLENGHADFPDGTIKMHENFRCIAAANTYGNGADRIYVGRNQLDGAFRNRFVFIEMGYDEKLERALANNDDWVDYVQSIRKAVNTLKIRHIVSPRASIYGARLLAAGQTKDKVIDGVIWQGLDSDTITKIKQAA